MFDSLRPLLHRALFWHGAALRCLAALLPPDLLHRELFVSGSGTVANGLKGAFTQGIVSPPGGLVLKHGQRRQRCRKLAQGPNLPCGAKLPPASVKMHVAINWIQWTVPWGSAALRRAAAKQRPLQKRPYGSLHDANFTYHTISLI